MRILTHQKKQSTDEDSGYKSSEIQIIKGNSYEKDIQARLQEMDRGLLDASDAVRFYLTGRQKIRAKRTRRQDLLQLDIAEISAVGFHFNMYRKDNEVFVTSLYEIDRMINAELIASEKQELSKLDELESEIAKELGAKQKD